MTLKMVTQVKLTSHTDFFELMMKLEKIDFLTFSDLSDPLGHDLRVAVTFNNVFYGP